MTVDPAGVKRAIIQIRYYGIVFGVSAGSVSLLGGDKWWLGLFLGVGIVAMAWFFAWIVEHQANLRDE